MFGVVLWTDSKNQSGIIWCEDQLQLACFRKGSLPVGEACLETGDMVTLEVQYRNGVRLARNVVCRGAANGGALGAGLKTRPPRAKIRAVPAVP